MDTSTALNLFAAANGQGAQDARPMYDAIIRGLPRGPVGIMDELAREGITTERIDRIADLEDDLAATREEREEAWDKAAELRDLVAALRDEIASLNRQLDETA